jgi:hypothetical protein
MQTPSTNVRLPRRPLGVTLLSLFFLFGAFICLVTLLALVFPGSFVDWIWRLKPAAHSDFESMGWWSLLLMAAVGTACFSAAVGLARLAPWGRRLALGVLTVNLLGDTISAAIRHDPRTLIGLPIGGAMILYLRSHRVRRRFAASADRNRQRPLKPPAD